MIDDKFDIDGNDDDSDDGDDGDPTADTGI
jgi:hypothetical protein